MCFRLPADKRPDKIFLFNEDHVEIFRILVINFEAEIKPPFLQQACMDQELGKICFV